MPVTIPVSQVAFGGNAANNPANYSWTDYSNYPGLDLTKSYVRMNVMFYYDKLSMNVQVTGLVQLNAMGFPMMNANDLVTVPCPPICQ